MNSLKQAAGNDQNLYQRLVNAIERAGSDRNIPPGGASGLATEGGPGQILLLIETFEFLETAN
jgi:hypothetical protein